MAGVWTALVAIGLARHDPLPRITRIVGGNIDNLCSWLQGSVQLRKLQG